jgi:hypothetical protein
MTREKQRPDGTYAALASGPGSFKRAIEAALRRPPPSEPTKAGPPPLPSEASPDTMPQRLAPMTRTDADGWEGAPLQAGATSPAYRRVLEELSAFLVPPTAHAILRSCLEDEGTSPAEAIPYDLRAILVEALPSRLDKVLPGDRASAALEAVEQTLVTMHAPPVGRRRRRSSQQRPAAPSLPPHC